MCKGGNFPCYAYRLAHGRLRERYLANWKVSPPDLIPYGMKYIAPSDNPFYPRFWAERLRELDPTTLGGHSSVQPKGIFVCDMGELFGNWVPMKWQEHIFLLIRKNPWHRFYLLTKQPQNLIKWSPFPENCWVGVTACNAQMLVNAMYHLKQIEAPVKYVSLEPLLERIIIRNEKAKYRFEFQGINWLIIGQQTPISAKTQPKIEWIDEIIHAAQKAKIPYFLKNNLKPIMGNNLVQDFPK